MTDPIYSRIIKTHAQTGLAGVFKDELGWDSKRDDFELFIIDTGQVRGQKIASLLNGVAVFVFDFSHLQNMPPNEQNQISKAVGAKYVERLIIIDLQNISLWLWPKKSLTGALTHEKIEVRKNSMPEFLAQRLAALKFSADEIMSGISVGQLRDRLRGSFDTSAVTKKFYEEFREQHTILSHSMNGLSGDDASSYASLLLNRLMFIYFLQKKEFLNNDPNYLKNCLVELRKLNVNSGFYNFYKDLLLVLFFEGLNKKERNYKTPLIEKIIGEIPYVNGGIFGETDLERENQIEIPDDAFEGIFEFFDGFTWHLDTRPTGKVNEINPEVMGYIFEQYINFTAGGRRENGAYYTKEDVTGYMVGQTVIPKILDLALDAGLAIFTDVSDSGDRYIHETMLHGWDSFRGSWIVSDQQLVDIWEGDPSGWAELDIAPLDDSICLPGESWVEAFHRQGRVEALRGQINSGGVRDVNSLITLNLNSHLVLLDTIASIKSAKQFLHLWTSLGSLSIIDPTCGSGAFLFAALEMLEDVYSGMLDVAQELAKENQSITQIVRDAESHPNRRYFIRKMAALNNLYGTDLMPDAIETAKLRVFLALASCLERREQIEPLPDLDFNFKCGNLIVGIKDIDDVDRFSEGDLVSKLMLQGLGSKIETYVESYFQFTSATELTDKSRQEAKTELQNLNREITGQCDQALINLLLISERDAAAWLELKRPFHWFAEFPQVFVNGGFDVVIGNPPYVKRSELDLMDLRGYETETAPDLFAVCYERSLELLNEAGRHAFIVMLNLSFSSGFDGLREVISKRNCSEWWSSFGKRPDSLFAGVQVRNTILALGPGNSKYSTTQQVFSKKSRSHLFTTLEYVEMLRDGKQIPKRSGIANNLTEKITAASFKTTKVTGLEIAMRKTGTYWFPGLISRPRSLNLDLSIGETLDEQGPGIKLFEGETREVAVACLVGKLGYLWWSATGDDFNAMPSQTLQPRAFALQAGISQSLSAIAGQVIESGYGVAFATKNAGGVQANIRWNAIREITDKFDYELLRLLGLESEWRPLNIWYRQVMKSSRDNSNGVALPEELARKIFPRNSESD